MKLSQAFFTRLFWFVLGGVASIAVNTRLYRLFHFHIGWGDFISYALSLTVVTVLLFVWNYVVGFKTDRHWKDSAWRQGVCQIGCLALNWAMTTTLFRVLPQPAALPLNPAQWADAIIAAVQVFIAFFKFGLYHYWVYPQKPAEPAPEAG